MPSAEVIPLERARRHTRSVRAHGDEAVNAIFREIDACIEAVPWLGEEMAKTFQGRDEMVIRSRSGKLATVAPTARLLGFRNLCRRVLKAKGLRVFVDPTPLRPDLPLLINELAERFGIDARLYEIARGLGLPLAGHAHAMGAGVGTL